MTEPQDFESLDELFRKTFDSLPESPSPSGWDRPSDRVWQHVQHTVQPPRNGWSTQAITMVSALVVTIAIGLYLFVSQPSKTDTNSSPVVAPATTTTPVISAPETVETVATVQISGKSVAARVGTSTPKQTVQAALPSTELEQQPVVSQQRPMGSMPLPGSKSAPPNNTVVQLETLWKTSLKPLPVLPEKIDRPTSFDLKK